MINLFRPLMSPTVPQAVAELLTPKADGSLYIGQGPKVEELETKLAEIYGREVLTTSSGTAAIELAMELIGVGPGDLVLCPAINCLHGMSPVRMADGREVRLRTLVTQKLEGPVMALNPETQRFEPRRIVGWIKAPADPGAWYRLTGTSGRSDRSVLGKRAIWVTADHEVLTHRGFVRADHLVEGDEIATSEPAPTDRQMEFIAGTLLGDGHIGKGYEKSCRSRFSVIHTESQREWLELKQKALAGFPSEIYERPARAQSKPAADLSTKSSVAWWRLRRHWYPKGRKIVPRDLQLTPLMLATLYMDDGCMVGDGALIATEAFGPESFWRLFWKVADLGLRPTSHYVRPRQTHLYIGNHPDHRSFDALVAMIGAYVPPSMRYKLPADAPPFDPSLWDLGHAEPLYEPVTAVRGTPTFAGKGAANSVYCLEVEGHHNFVAADMVVKNCTAGTCVVVMRGAVPIWADVDAHTGLIDVHDVARKLREYHRRPVKAIMAVDWAGRLCDYDRLQTLSLEFDVRVIEDAAHRGPEPIADDWTADYVVLSFQAIKFLTAGDGGALACPDERTLDEGRLVRWYGLDRRSSASFRCAQNVGRAGLKWHMNDIAATIALENIAVAKQALARQKANAEFYYGRFKTLTLERHGIRPPPADPTCSWWIYTMLAQDRPSFEAFMLRCGIETGQVHARNDRHDIFHYPNGPLPGTDYFCDRQVSIPIGHWLTDAELDLIADCVLRYGRGER